MTTKLQIGRWYHAVEVGRRGESFLFKYERLSIMSGYPMGRCIQGNIELGEGAFPFYEYTFSEATMEEIVAYILEN